MKKNKSVILALVIACVLAVVFIVMYVSEDREARVLKVNKSNIKEY